MATWTQTLVRKLKVGAHQATVVDNRIISPNIRVVRLAAPSFVDAGFSPGCKVKLRVGPKAMRSYTPLGWDDAGGWVDILFHLHGSGPGSDWARGAATGDGIEVRGPVKSMSTDHDDPDWTLFLGDETTLGLAATVRTVTPNARNFGAVELDRLDVAAPDVLGLQVEPVIRNGIRGAALQRWLRDCELPEGYGVVWISGHAGTAKLLKQAIAERKRNDVSVNFKAYWDRPKDRAKGRGLT